MKIDPSRIPDMQVCRACRDIVGCFHRLDLEPHRGLRGHRVQRGTCRAHKPSAFETSWPGFDFNRQVDLCFCCGTVALMSGSRTSTWFCEQCDRRARRFNARSGRIGLPLGRDELTHGGGRLFQVAAVLVDWRHMAIARGLERILRGDALVVGIEEYCERTGSSASRPGRFAEMCEYVTMRAGTFTDRSGPARRRRDLARARGR